MKLVAAFGVLCALCLCSTGCTKHVTASCQPQAPSIRGFSAVETQGLGFINLAGSPVGEVFELDSDGKGGFYANHVDFIHYSKEPNNTNYTEGFPQDSTVQVAISWDIAGDVRASSAKAVKIEAALDHSMSFNVKEGTRSAINNTLSSLNEPSNLNLKQLILAHPQLVYMVMNPVQLGRKANLSLANAAKANANVKLGWAVTADVTYSCKADTLISSIADGPKATLIVYPEFLRVNAGTIDHVGGYNEDTVTISSGPLTIRDGPSSSPRISRPLIKILICRSSGNDLTLYPGCKNQ